MSALPPWSFARIATLGGLAIVVCFVFLLRVFYIEIFKINEADMAPTLVATDRIFAHKSAYGRSEHRVPERGDVVIFRSPDHPEQDIAQRVIGLPGDVVAVQQGMVLINGWRVPTCVIGMAPLVVDGKERSGVAVVELLGDTAYLVLHDEPKHAHDLESAEHEHGGEMEGPYTVPANEVFVLGDNREHSRDSRLWFEGRGGGVPVDRIKGRASSVWLAYQPAGGIAWSRIGSSLTVAPQCPAHFPPTTCTALERCLANRPPHDITTPPSAH